MSDYWDYYANNGKVPWWIYAIVFIFAAFAYHFYLEIKEDKENRKKEQETKQYEPWRLNNPE
jgi:uncharacterized membrane protein